MPQDDFAARAAKWDQQPERQATARAFLEASAQLDSELAGGLAGGRLEGRVLDFGAGTGLIGLPLAAKAKSVDFVDTSEGMLEVLRGKIAAQGLANTATHLGELDELAGRDLPEAGFDAILTNNALHHVADIPPLLARLAGLLAPGGALFVGDVAEEDGSFHAPNIVPHNGFRPEAMGAMLESAGLRVAATVRHHTIRKTCHDGVTRDFPQFLILAEKP